MVIHRNGACPQSRSPSLTCLEPHADTGPLRIDPEIQFRIESYTQAVGVSLAEVIRKAFEEYQRLSGKLGRFPFLISKWDWLSVPVGAPSAPQHAGWGGSL